MLSAYIVPACIEYKQRLQSTLDTKDKFQEALLTTYNKNFSGLLGSLEELKKVTEKAAAFDEHKLHEQATFYRKEVMDVMNKARVFCDQLELDTDDKLWPFPKYSELLFLK